PLPLAWRAVCRMSSFPFAYRTHGVAQPLQQNMGNRGLCSSSGAFRSRGRLLYIETSAAFPFSTGPLFPPPSGDSPLSAWGNQSHPERAKEHPYESYGMYFWLCRLRGCGTLLESLCLQVWQISGMEGITAQTHQVSEETYCHQRRRNAGRSD